MAHIIQSSLSVTGSIHLTGALTGSVTGSVTGDLFGNATTSTSASYATQALSSSYALTSSITTAVSGSSNYVPKFTGDNILGDSVIYESGSKVGIGTSAPTARLHISSSGALSTDIALRVRNNANTADLLSVAGNGSTIVSSLTATSGMSISVPSGYYYPAISFYNNGGSLQGIITGYNSKLLTTNVLVQSGYSLGVGFAPFDSIYAHLQVKAQDALSTSNSFAVLNNAYNTFLFKVQNNGSIGVGISSSLSPTSRFHIVASSSLSTESAFKIQKSGSTSDLFNIGGTGNTTISGSLEVTSGITGSLQGTASYATQALSASWAPSTITGSANYIPKFTDATTLGDSVIYESGSNIGIGTTAPSVKLDTAGYVRDTKTVGEQESFSLAANWSGDVIEGSIDEINGSVSTWDLIYLATDGIWYQVDDTNVNSTYMLGIYLGSNLVLLEGHITVNDIGVNGPNIQGLDEGLPIYIRDGALGQMSTILPTTSNNYVRICGHAYYKSVGEAGNFVMKFKPSNDWIQI